MTRIYGAGKCGMGVGGSMLMCCMACVLVCVCANTLHVHYGESMMVDLLNSNAAIVGCCQVCGVFFTCVLCVLCVCVHVLPAAARCFSNNVIS